MALKVGVKKVMSDQDNNINEAYENFKKFSEMFGAATPEMAAFIKATSKGSKEFKKTIDDLNKEIKKGKAGYEKQKQVLDALNDAIEELGDTSNDASKTTEKQRLLAERDALAHSAMMKGVTEDVSAGVTKSVVSLTMGAGQFVKGLQANQSAAQLSGDLFNTGIDIAASGMKTIGGITEKIGDKMLTSANPIVAGIGLVVSAAGMLTSASVETAAKIVKFGVAVAQAEVEKTFKAFNSMTASGAMFVDGMTGMRTAAGEAGLTVDLFAGVLKNQSANIGASGLGMTEGAKRIGGALSTGGTAMKKNLLNLGYGFEEQAELVAETMKSMRGSTSGPLKASNQQVAEQTQKYAENLRIIAAITGEDAKKKMAQVQDEANQLAFQQKLARKSPEEQAAIMRGFSNMNSLQRKNFMDMVNFGSVVNTEGAAAAALSGGLRDSVSEAYQNYQKGTLDDATMRDINSRENGRMQKDYLDQVGIGLAGAAGLPGLAGDLAKSFMQGINEIKGATPEAIKAAEENAKAQKTTSDSLTKSVMGAEVAAMRLKTDLQEILTPAIEDFAKISHTMLNAIKDQLADMGYGQSTAQKTKNKQNTVEMKSQYNEKYGGWGQMQYENDVATWNREQAGKRKLKDLKESGDEEGYNTMLADINRAKEHLGNLRAAGMAPADTGPSMVAQYMTTQGTVPVGKYANGGIASGSVSGYSAELHGTEAVVPLPDGKTIPVKLDSSSLNAAMQEQTGLLHSILASMVKGNHLTSGILQNSM